MANYYEIHSQSITASTKLVKAAHQPVCISGLAHVGCHFRFCAHGDDRTEGASDLCRGNDRTDDIPNRDAAEYRIDEANLFLPHAIRVKIIFYPVPASMPG